MTTSVTPRPPSSPQPKCSACGAEVQRRAAYCWLCGQYLEGGAPSTNAARGRRGPLNFLAGCILGVILVPLSVFILVMIVCSRGFR